MICYPESINEVEMLVVNEYWEIAEGTTDNFLRTAKSIYEKYKIHKIRPIHQIIKGSLFLSDSINFQCRECGEKMPVSTRKEYKYRLNLDAAPSCENCVQDEVIRRLSAAQSLVKKYNKENFSPESYLDCLTLTEMLAFLSLVTGNPRYNRNSSQPLESIPVTGIEYIDKKLYSSLKEKGAIIDARTMPDEILCATRLISETLSYMRSGHYPRLTHDDFKVRAVSTGVYFRYPVVHGEVIEENIPEVILKSIREKEVLQKDIEEITHIITEIQNRKLHQAIDQIRKDDQIRIEESLFLNSILYYFSKNHAPVGTYYSLINIAMKTVYMISTGKVSRGAEKHVFAKSLSDYSQGIEKNNWSLDYTKPLPVSCQNSPFEAMFATQYCGKFNFDTLSAREVIKRWLESVAQSSASTDIIAWDRMYFDSSTS